MVMKRLVAVGLVVLLAGLMFLAAGCGPGGGSSTAVTSSPSGTAVKLAFTTQPVGAVSGSSFGAQPVVAVEDVAGNIATAGTFLIELTLTPGAAPGEPRLLGGTKIASVNGIAEFRSLSIDKAGTYNLTATSGTLTPATSAPLSIVPGPPVQLAFTTQPSGGIAGAPFTTQPVVTVQDRFGNTVTGYQGSVTLSATITLPNPNSNSQYTGQPEMSTTGATIHGTLTVPAVDSVARFTDISAVMAIPGYQLTARSGSLVSATSGFFEITAAAPSKLVFTVQPQGAEAGSPFEIQPKVAIEDIYGNVVISSRASISLSITAGSGVAGANLSGTTTLVAKDAMGGLTEFTNLSIDLAGPAYKLTATSSDLPPETSQAFDVSSPTNPP
jgi:hypothetical protein